MVERCLALLAGRERPRVLDVGTGSGAIGFAIADEHLGARVIAVDASEDALELARENAARTGLEEVRRHDLFAACLRGPWDLVVSNPPYVDPGDSLPAAPEVREWELEIAGHGATEAIARGALDVLYQVDGLVLEVADGTAGSVGALLGELGYQDVRATADPAGRDRVVEGPPVTDTVTAAVAALRAGGAVVIPTDTVYGLAVLPESEHAVRTLYGLKGRAEAQPTALVASSVARLLELVPELGRSEQILSALLPGAYTPVFPNPAGRYRGFSGPAAPTIGVRVPAGAGPGADVLAAVGSVAATSANFPGGLIRAGSRTSRTRSSRVRPLPSTAASCRAPRRRCSTSASRTWRVLREEPCRRPRRSQHWSAWQGRASGLTELCIRAQTRGLTPALASTAMAVAAETAAELRRAGLAECDPSDRSAARA